MKKTGYTWKKIFASHIYLIREYIQNIYRTPTNLQQKHKRPNFKKMVKDLNEHLFKEDMQMTYELMKGCSTCRVARECKSRLGNTHTPKVAIIRGTITSVDVDVEKLKPLFTADGSG